MKSLIPYALVAVAATSCADRNYVYQPETTNASAAGLPASRTPIPQEAPQGAVEVTSYGVTMLDEQTPALHARLVVTNDGDDTPWHLDTRQQLVEIPGEGKSAPIFVNADVQGLPDVTIAKQQRRVLDFYYPLPATMQDEKHLPRFEMLWQVQTGQRLVASRTSFDRVERQPEVATYEYGATWPLWAGYGPYWWYDPFYSHVVFVHSRPGIVIHNHRAPVIGRFNGHFRAGGHVTRR